MPRPTPPADTSKEAIIERARAKREAAGVGEYAPVSGGPSQLALDGLPSGKQVYGGPAKQKVPDEKLVYGGPAGLTLRSLDRQERERQAVSGGPSQLALDGLPSGKQVYGGPAEAVVPDLIGSKEQVYGGPAKQALTYEQATSIDFWTRIGYPQFAGKYAPFIIPKGKKIYGVQEVGGQLNVSFIDPEQRERYRESYNFYRDLGFQQYGGKYAPFDVPEGAQVKNIVESSGGLQIELSTLDVPASQQQLTPEEQAYLDMIGGRLPPRSHFGPPSGYSSVPVNLPELVSQGKVKVEGSTYVFIKPASGVWIDRLTDTKVTPLPKGGVDLTGYRIVDVTDTQLTLEEVSEQQTLAPSGFEKLAGVDNPFIASFAKDVKGAKEFQKDPTGYTTKKVLEIGAGAAALVNPVGAVVGGALGAGVAQGYKSVLGGGLLTAEELRGAVYSGALFNVAVGGAVGPVGKTLKPFLGEGVGGFASKLAVNVAAGAGIGYLASGGDVEAAKAGALFAGGLTVASVGAGYVYGKTLKPYVQVAGAKIQAAGQKYITERYLATGKVSVADKVLAKVLRVDTPKQSYIVGGGEPSGWSLAREEATVGKALIPKQQAAIKATPAQSWAKATQWSKPSSLKSTLNKYVGSGQKQAVSLKTLMSQPAQKVTQATIQLPKAVPLPVVQKTQQKQVLTVVPFTGVVWEPMSSIANPFTQYAGKPFYGQKQKTRDVVETVFLSVPKSGLPSPALLPKTVTRVTPVLESITIPSIVSLPRQFPIQKPVAVPTMVPVQEPVQMPVEVPALIPIEIPKGVPFQVPRLTPILTPVREPKLTPIQEPVRVPVNVPFSLPVQSPVVEPISVPVQSPVELVKQVPVQSAAQRIITETKTDTRLLSEEFGLRKFKRVKPVDFMGGFGRYKREYPIATGEEVLGFVLNGKRRKRKR